MQIYVAGLDIFFLNLYAMNEIMTRKTTDVCGCLDVNA